MRIDLLGNIPDDEKNLYVWRNTWEKSNGTTLYETCVLPALPTASFSLHFRIDANLPGPACSVVNPHSNAVLDLDGDCLAGLYSTEYNCLTRSVPNAMDRPIPSLRRPEYETSILPGVAERPRHRVLQAQAERVPSSWGRADHLRRYGQVHSFSFV